jgi:small-conductance mechanosensitive channel
MRRFFDTVETSYSRFDQWANRNSALWNAAGSFLKVFLVAFVAVVLLAAAPPLLALALVLAIVSGVVLFARAWLREFWFLMRLGDDSFPSQHDKLIWAVLMIVLPPVGVYLFGRFRLAHWPEAKPSTAHDYF